MTQQQVAEGIGTWVVDTCDPVIVTAYSHVPESKPDGLPDAVVDILSRRTAINDPAFPMQQLQQVWLRIYTVEISVMVDNEDRPAAAETLNDYCDQLEASAMKDGTLGGNVPFISPFFAFDLSHPFVEWQDGTRGREMTMTLQVGDFVEAPE